MEDLKAIKGFLADLRGSVEGLREQAVPLTQRPLTEQALEYDDPVDEANLYTLFAYSIDSILFAYLKSKGVDTNSHPIMKELERVKGYMAKVKEAKEKNGSNGSNSTKQSSENISGSKLDKEAADRMIRSAISLPKKPVFNNAKNDTKNDPTNDSTNDPKNEIRSVSGQKRKKSVTGPKKKTKKQRA